MTTLKWTMMISALTTLLVFSACEKDDNNDNVQTEPATLLDCDFARDDTTLVNDPNKAIDYIIDCQVFVGGVLTIEPGVVIQFETDAGLEIGDNGTLVAIGNAQNKIVLEGVTATKGAWSGVIVFSNDVRNTMEHVEIRHAGGSGFNSNDDRGNIIIYADGRLKLDHVLSEMSATYGLNAAYWDMTLDVSNSVFTDNDDEPVQIPATNLHQLDPSNDYTGNANDVIKVTIRSISDLTATWEKQNVPYFFTRRNEPKQTMNTDGHITIAPGVELIFDSDCGMQAYGGSITAVGTASEPILFTGLTKQPGAWKGLLFRTNDQRNQLDHVTIEYTGSGSFNSNGDEGAIIVWADAYLSISNSTLRESSADCAINAPYSDETVVESGNSYLGFASNYCDN